MGISTKVIITVLNMKDNMSKGLLATAKNIEKVDKGSVSATRSAPNEAGLSSLMLSPVFSPGPTTSGFLPVMVRSAVFITLVSGGTTEEIIEPSISPAL